MKITSKTPPFVPSFGPTQNIKKPEPAEVSTQKTLFKKLELNHYKEPENEGQKTWTI